MNWHKGSNRTTWASSRHRERKPSPYLDQDRLHVLQIMLSAHMDDVLSALAVRLHRTGKLYIGRCPIHLGDNPGALNLYRKGDTRPGFWQCHTKSCHEIFGQTILGFVRGVLSQQQLDWQYYQDLVQRKAQPKFPWQKTIDWCCQLLGKPLEEIEVNYEELDKERFVEGIRTLSTKPEQEKEGIPREQVRSFLKRPASYFVQRGWSPEILNRYDVGLYPAAGRPLSNRVVVPVYDDNHQRAIGFSGRTIYERCSSCNRYHSPDESCPEGEYARMACKWRHEGFKRESFLYNYWFAKRHIQKDNLAILCEGPGDVWRLEEASIQCGLAMMGRELSDRQQVILEMSGANSVIVLTDNDEAGLQAREKIKRQLGRTFRLHFPDLTRQDVGETPVEEIRAVLAPLLKKRGG